jgi:hypothetical protein
MQQIVPVNFWKEFSFQESILQNNLNALNEQQ